MIKIKFQTEELYSVQLKSLNILHKTTWGKEHVHFNCTMYSAYISFKQLLPLLGVSRHDQGLPVPKK